MVGWPALSLPAGFDSDGLPIGVQLLGRENDEATLLALGAELEAAGPAIAAQPQLLGLVDPNRRR